MIDFKGFSDLIVAQILEVYPKTSEKFIRDEVDNMTLLGKMDSRRLARRYNHLCDNCGWCCEDTGCHSYVLGACKYGDNKPEICQLYPCYLVDNENGIYPDPTCALAVKIVKYEIMAKLR